MSESGIVGRKGDGGSGEKYILYLLTVATTGAVALGMRGLFWMSLNMGRSL